VGVSAGIVTVASTAGLAAAAGGVLAGLLTTGFGVLGLAATGLEAGVFPAVGLALTAP